jgi:2-oxoglutarate dehydrogenase E1 component
MLSEYAVLGFEYGYSLAEPNALVMWEAQFGDFANGAQIMFDQFINSGESQVAADVGPCDASAARLRRPGAGTFLRASGTLPADVGQDNWIVANCSTPANYFHILRRQIHRTFRKPLILMTPKSLLRHPMCISKAEEFTTGSSFHRVLWDDAQKGNSTTEAETRRRHPPRRDLFGQGLLRPLAERDKRGIDDVYLLRLEQFYPFPALSLVKELERFKQAEIVWCQEEPKNQGAWSFVEPNLEWVLTRIGAKHKRAAYVGPRGLGLARHGSGLAPQGTSRTGARERSPWR